MPLINICRAWVSTNSDWFAGFELIVLRSSLLWRLLGAGRTRRHLALISDAANHSRMTPAASRIRSAPAENQFGNSPNAAAFSLPTAAALAAGVLVIHILTNLITPYGIHRDELLYLAMGEHLRLWHMDFPPFIAIVARFSHALFGDWLPGIRLAPAFAHAALVFASAYATALFGGRRSAQTLAALGIAVCPYFLRPGAMLQPVVFDQLWWTLALLALTLRIYENDPKHWAGAGLFLGLAALTKFSVAFIAAGVILALIVTPLRRDLATKFPWIGLIIATILGHPSVIGQVTLGWPVRGQLSNLQSSQLARVGPLDFLSGQLWAGPVLILAILGFVALWRSGGTGIPSKQLATMLRSEALTPTSLTATTPNYRPIAVATATAFLILLFMRGKAYYIAPIYPILTAAGAAALDRIALRIAPKRPSKVLAVAAAMVALYGMVTLPFGLPLLVPAEMARVSEMLDARNESNVGEQLALPQDYADMLGWRELATMTATVWHALSPADTANAILVGTNYGRAGALDLYGPDLGLPPAISATGSYWFFGPGNKSGDVAVVPANDADDLKKFWRECTEAVRTTNPWGVPEEQTVHIYVCRGALRSIQDAWPTLAGQH